MEISYDTKIFPANNILNNVKIGRFVDVVEIPEHFKCVCVIIAQWALISLAYPEMLWYRRRCDIMLELLLNLIKLIST